MPDAPAQPAASSVLTGDEKQILTEVRMLTMLSTERLVANMDAVAYAVQRQVPGAIVECGVWRGGSVLAMIRVLQRLGVTDRDVYLYDTFEGMTAPGAEDTSPFEPPAGETWTQTPDGATPWGWAFDAQIYDLDFVRAAVLGSGYPEERIHFVAGPVEQTVPATVPQDIAVLRLDTDWYESTLHELRHLYPRMSPGGVLIVDDFGHWDGARRAVEEYFATEAQPILLARTDYTGRMGVKH
ncbi:MAG: class I SAM-dependent methyltransferase [Streptomyces sp.]|uniref:TylF/MycF/NovP-related O-methyltransferase n=1 Tax=Streptomyces sp. TaxID=1931 RepID=UPI0025EDFED2|nr:TylF/MycF/NovP-related O-methyltransferase [Streptomyces sp.]MBW8792226.1 class I SAM-dependent methyltransferase [Streptomyces sp.]